MVIVVEHGITLFRNDELPIVMDSQTIWQQQIMADCTYVRKHRRYL